jgi:hypothetical protein
MQHEYEERKPSSPHSSQKRHFLATLAGNEKQLCSASSSYSPQRISLVEHERLRYNRSSTDKTPTEAQAGRSSIDVISSSTPGE